MIQPRATSSPSVPDVTAGMTIALVAVAAALLVLFTVTGHVVILGAIVGYALFAVFAYVKPVPALVLTMLTSTSVFQFVDLSYLPYLQLGATTRLNAEDILVLTLLAMGVAKLIRRGERPLFLTQMLLVAVAALISLVVGVVAHTTDVSTGLNSLRGLAGYPFYIALVGAIDSRGRLRWTLGAVFALMVLSVVIQAFEAATGQRLVLPTSVASDYFSTTKVVAVGDQWVPYLWNRAPGYLFVSLLLAAGAALWCWSPKYLGIALVALVGILTSLVRQWYVLVFVGVLVTLALSRRGRTRAIVALLVALALAGFVATVLSYTGLVTSYPFVDVWLARLDTIGSFQNEPHFVARVQLWQQSVQYFLGAPLFGYGPGGDKNLYFSAAAVLADTGAPNTLLQFGAFGIGVIMVLIVEFLRKGLALLNRLDGRLEQGYAAGLMGAWVGIIAGYSFGLDFFTSPELLFAVALAMALVDRLYRFGPARSLAPTAIFR